MAPVSWNGANTIYHRVIKPFVLKHQTQIDKALDKVGQKVDEVAKEGISTKHLIENLQTEIISCHSFYYLHSIHINVLIFSFTVDRNLHKTYNLCT